MSADQARITIARDLLAQLGVTLADLRGDGTPASTVPTLADYLPCVIASAGPGANRTYGSYWIRMAAAWGTRPLDQISASDIPVHVTSDFTSTGQSADGGLALRDEDVHSPWPTSLASAPSAHCLSSDPQAATAPVAQFGEPLRARTGGGLPLPRLLPPAAHPVLYCAVTPMDDRGRLADRSLVLAAGWQPGQPITITTAPDHRHVAVHPDGPDRITGHGHLRLPARVRRAFHLSPGDRLLVTVTATPPRLTVYPMATLAAILSQHTPVPAAETP
jgi:hypothetical protein